MADRESEARVSPVVFVGSGDELTINHETHLWREDGSYWSTLHTGSTLRFGDAKTGMRVWVERHPPRQVVEEKMIGKRRPT